MLYVFSTILLLIQAGGLYARDDEVGTISSPQVTNWGDWYGPSYCPPGMWAIGAQLRTEGLVNGGRGDDTALNAVKLLCAPLGMNTVYQEITPFEGLFGGWGRQFLCRDSVLIGFTLRSERNLGSGDDTAGNNLKILCSNQQEFEMDGMSWGDWTARQTCPRGSGVCGMEEQIENNQQGADDTALNNIRMKCCRIPGDSCHPVDEWRVIQSCSNVGNPTPIKCSYSYTTGMSTTTTISESQRDQLETSLKIGAQVGAEFMGLGAKFSTELGVSRITGYDWRRESSTTFTQASVATQEFVVPPGRTKRMEQTVGTCGSKMVFTKYTRFIEE